MALAPRFDSVHLWSRDPLRAEQISALRENTRYLAGYRLPDNVQVSSDLARALAGETFCAPHSPISQPRPTLSVQPRALRSERFFECPK
jgi:glycerol-3-phosphate dehydrogenase (NAD(P)+)